MIITIAPMSNSFNSDAPTRSVTDDRIVEESPGKKQRGRHMTASDGDVTVVVEPSFDVDSKEDTESWQGNCSAEDVKLAGAERLAGKEVQSASHTRNLSAHFFDAARIRDRTSPIQTAQGVSFDDQSQLGLKEAYPVQRRVQPSSSPTADVPPLSPATNVGQKHSRGFSDDFSNPAFAHRRINSIGNVAQVERGPAYHGSYPNNTPPSDRPMYPPVPTGHHRKESEGFDLLVHAFNVSKEEFAAAAGAPGPLKQPETTEPPSGVSSDALPPARSSPHEPMIFRSSPSNDSSGATYEYAHAGSMSAPQFRPPPSQPGYHVGPGAGYYPPPYYQGSYYRPAGAPPRGFPAPQAYNQRQSPPMSYPTQYAPPRGSDPYAKEQYHQSHQQPSHKRAASGGVIETDEQLFANRTSTQYQATPPGQWGAPPRPGTTTGSQTFVTTIGVGEGNRTIRPMAHKKTVSTNTDPSKDPPPIPATVGHHRKLSSFSSLSTLMNAGPFPGDPAYQCPPMELHQRSASSSMSFLQNLQSLPNLDDKMVTGHHRSTSSSVSMFQGFDDTFDPNEAFTQGMEGNRQQYFSSHVISSPFGSVQKAHHYTGSYGRGQPRPRETTPAPAPPLCLPVPSSRSADKKLESSELASGGTSKRARRKCTVPNCLNRVVQGGKCIAHGAKRKTCRYPGCTKNVKKAGLCSTHGPARKRCEVEGCKKVSVQGGRCIAHGAKKKLCEVGGCKKQAILSGMCKKHHDENDGAFSNSRRASDASEATTSPASGAPIKETQRTEKPSSKPTHTRGLSIFQELCPEDIPTTSEPGQDHGAYDM